MSPNSTIHVFVDTSRKAELHAIEEAFGGGREGEQPALKPGFANSMLRQAQSHHAVLQYAYDSLRGALGVWCVSPIWCRLRCRRGVCLAGSTYPIADVLVSDLCLGFHPPVDGAKPRAWAWCGQRRVFLGVCATIGGGGERAGPLEEERRRQ